MQHWHTFQQKSVSSRMARFPRDGYDESLGSQHLIHTNLSCLITAACRDLWVRSDHILNLNISVL